MLLEGLVQDRLAYCDNCQTMRPFFEAAIPNVSSDPRRGNEYVCADCASIIATFQHVTPDEVTSASNALSRTRGQKPRAHER